MWLCPEQLAEKVALTLKLESKKSRLRNSKHKEPRKERRSGQESGTRGVGHGERNKHLGSLRQSVGRSEVFSPAVWEVACD